MAQNNIGCDFTRGIELPHCHSTGGLFGRGGAEQLFIVKAEWVDENGYGYDQNDLITGVTMFSSQKFKEIELQFETTTVSDKEVYDQKSGAYHFEPTITFLVYRNHALNRKLVLELMNSQQLIALYKDNNGRWFLMGKDNFLRAQVDSISTGKGFADFNGYSISLMGLEKFPAYEIDPSIISSITETNLSEDCCLFRSNSLQYSQLFDLYDYRDCNVSIC